MRALGAALALALLAPGAGAFDLLECDRDDVFGNSGANVGWANNGAAMGTWELDSSGAPGSMISTGNALHALEAAVHEWAVVTSTARASCPARRRRPRPAEPSAGGLEPSLSRRRSRRRARPRGPASSHGRVVRDHSRS